MPWRRRWWVHVELATDFDHVRDRDLIQDLRGYLGEILIYREPAEPTTIGLLLGIMGPSKAQAKQDARILVSASASVPIVKIEVVSAFHWRGVRRSIKESVRLPYLPTPSDYVAWQQDRLPPGH